MANDEASGSGSKSHGKIKQKKAPQRGLGVAQLEKMRLEELRKEKEGGALSLTPSNSSSSSSSGLGDKPRFSSSSSSLFRTSSLNPFSDSNPFSNQLNVSRGASGGVGFSAAISGLNNQGFSYPSDLNHGSNPPFSRTSMFAPHHFHSSSSMMNLSTGTSSFHGLNQKFNLSMNPSYSSSMMNVSSTGVSSSSGLRWSSSQSFNGSKEKITGMKRANPFTMESSSAQNFHPKYPSISRLMDESATSSNNRNTIRSGPSIITSEVPVRSILSPQPTREEMKETRKDFLLMGQSISQFRQVSSMLRHENQEMLDFGVQPGNNEDNGVQETRPRILNRTDFFGFLDPTMPADQNASMGNNGSEEEEVEETLDLTLKL